MVRPDVGSDLFHFTGGSRRQTKYCETVESARFEHVAVCTALEKLEA